MLILHGGPGGEQTRYMGMSREDLAPGRDSIAFDMRGGGRTGPALCPDLPGALLAATRAELEGRDAVAARSAALAACGSLAALFATDCRDRARHHALAAGSGPSWMALFGGIPEGACRPWPLGTPPGLPAGTAVPVLVLAAGYDAFQPDAQAVAAAIGPAATALTIPRAAHVVRGAGACPRGIVAGFIADPTKAPDAACLASMNAPPFLLDARPLPAAVALAAAIESGRLPGAAPAAIAGLGLLLVAGVLVPTARWLRQRRSRIPAVASGGRAPRALALAGGLCGVGGAVLPMLGTLHGHPGAAAFGLDPTLAPGPVGLALRPCAVRPGAGAGGAARPGRGRRRGRGRPAGVGRATPARAGPVALMSPG